MRSKQLIVYFSLFGLTSICLGKRDRIDTSEQGIFVSLVVVLSMILCLHFVLENIRVRINILAPHVVLFVLGRLTGRSSGILDSSVNQRPDSVLLLSESCYVSVYTL